MTDRDFEHELERMFAKAPPTDSDDDAFAAAVSRRIDRAWALRGALIGGLGLVGGVIAVGEVAASGLVARVAMPPGLAAALVSTAQSIRPPVWLASITPSILGAPSDIEAWWVAGAMAIIGLGVAGWRAIDDN